MLVLNLEEKPPSKLLNPLKDERVACLGSKRDPVVSSNSSAATRVRSLCEFLTLTAAEEKTAFLTQLLGKARSTFLTHA